MGIRYDARFLVRPNSSIVKQLAWHWALLGLRIVLAGKGIFAILWFQRALSTVPQLIAKTILCQDSSSILVQQTIFFWTTEQTTTNK